MRRVSIIIGLILLNFACYAGEPRAHYVPPHYNFSAHDVLLDRSVVPPGVTVVVFGGEQPYLNGFFAPLCRLKINGREVTLHNAVFLNIDVALKTKRSIDQVLLHELAHYRQYVRCGGADAYYAEWRRQQALPYWERPWEIEAHQAEKQATKCVFLLGKRTPSAIAIRFESDQGRLSNRVQP